MLRSFVTSVLSNEVSEYGFIIRVSGVLKFRGGWVEVVGKAGNVVSKKF